MRSVRSLLGLTLLSGALAVSPCALGLSGDTTTKVVVNAEVKSTPNDQQLRAIYTMRLRRWPDGQVIRVFVLPDTHPVHVAFAERRLRVLPHLLRRAWDRLVHSGTGDAPIQVSDEARMREAVARTPGAIGYMSINSGDEGVRVVGPNGGEVL